MVLFQTVIQVLLIGFGSTKMVLSGSRRRYTWSQSFFGGIPGSVGETSLIAIALGAMILLMTRIASYPIILGTLLGMFVMSSILIKLIQITLCFSIPFYWHLVIGSFAFGLVFMAAELYQVPLPIQVDGFMVL